MSLDEFYKWLEKQPIEDKLVYMRYKYSWENEWTCSNEYLEVDMSVEGYYIWLMDWNEGQDDVEILGCIGVDDIDVPLFNVQKDNEEYLEKQAEQEPKTGHWIDNHNNTISSEWISERGE